MYSVKKSFVAIAIGFCEQDVVLSLDYKFAKFFPKYLIFEKVNNFMREQTIRNMLMTKKAQTFLDECKDSAVGK